MLWVSDWLARCAGVGMGRPVCKPASKGRLYSGGTGQEHLRVQLESAGGVESLLEAVKLAWPGERVPAGALEALRWSGVPGPSPAGLVGPRC
jgi:hypothetical protein